MERAPAAATVLLSLMATSCGAGPAPQTASYDAAPPPIESVVDSLVRADSLPGVSVVVTCADRVLETATAGVRRLDTGWKLRPVHRMHLGSVTKPFTATMIARLVERGRLEWSRTVGATFGADSVHPLLRSVSLEQLLRHEAGIAPFEEDEDFEVAPKLTGSVAQRRHAFALWLLRQPPAVAPGTRHLYSNAGYVIAAAMAEHVTSQTWEALMRDEVFRPLGLRSAGFGWPARGAAGEPHGHMRADGSWTPHAPDGPYQLEDLYLGPAGDLHMSVLDLARFGQEHLRGREGREGILAAETFRYLHTATVGEYALGWNVRSFGNHHLGGAGTFAAALAVLPEQGLVIALAANADADAGAIASTIVSAALRRYGAACERS